MAKNITLLGASYSNVPAVELPQTGGGTAKFTDTSPTTATDSDVASGKIYFKADGSQSTGTSSGGGGGAVVVTDTTDIHGGTIREITAVDISSDTVTAAALLSGYTAHDNTGTAVSGSIATKTSSDLIASGDTVTVPAGYYASQATKAVAAGSATAPATISGSGATVSTGTNTLTLSKTVSVTPSVTAGYVSSGTAGNSSVSLSASVTTKGAATIAPSTSNQTIASGTYLTGAQTIAAVTTTNLSAANIVSGVTVKVGYSGDDDCVASVTGTASGSSKNAQAHESTTRATSSTYTSVNSFTCTKAGKYTVYYSCMRSSTSGTSGSQLYIGGSAYGTADTTTWSNHVQNKMVTGVTIGLNQTVAVYARSRGSNYYAYAPLLTIIEE